MTKQANQDQNLHIFKGIVGTRGEKYQKTTQKNPLFSSSQSDEPSSQLAYFCGFGAECQRGSGGRSEMRLIRAKRNVDMFYAVVGVLEDMPGTIKALEGYIPRWALCYFLVVFSSQPN